MNTPQKPPDNNRLTELEGLRGLLAWWVVAGHAVVYSGFSSDNAPAPLRFLLHADIAVDVFIILSGFVIWRLLDRSRPSYRVFITQRFFRLYPAYLCCLLAAVPLGLYSVRALQTLPWAEGKIVSWLIAEHLQTDAHFWPHFLTHLTMLHGAVPAEVLPNSPTAILGPAWSISLEWQFYLAAPVIMALLLRGRWALIILSVGVLGCAVVAPAFGDMFTRGKILTYSLPAFLPLKALYFFCGGASYLATKSLAKVSSDTLGRVAIVALVFAAGFAKSLALVIWAGVLGAHLLAARGESYPGFSILARFLNSTFMQWAGRISYSTYLCHTPVQGGLVVLLAWYSREWNSWPFLIALSALCVPTILAISHVLHRFVEVPFIEMGKRWKARATAPRTASAINPSAAS